MWIDSIGFRVVEERQIVFFFRLSTCQKIEGIQTEGEELATAAVASVDHE
jgi:hypothetical protein